MEIVLPETILRDVLGAALHIGAALLVMIAGRWLARRSRIWLAHSLKRVTLTPSMESLFTTLTYYGVWIVTLMVALIVLGVPATSVLAVAAVVLLLLGLALQQSLRDLAAAVNFLLFKPFQVGDLIETRGITAVVEEIQLFSTVLVRWDNKVVVLPNGEIQQSGIVNYTKKHVLRTDLVFGIGYEDDIDKAMDIIKSLAAADERIHGDPAPMVVVGELADSSVNLITRVWCNAGDYWGIKFDLTKAVKQTFDKEDVTIPFPQRDVHLYNAAE